MEAITAGPGLFIVIRDEVEREEFLRTRHRDYSTISLPALSLPRSRKIQLTSEEEQLQVPAYWDLIYRLGRFPRPSELPSDLRRWVIIKFGNPKRAVSWLTEHFGKENIEYVAEQKRDRLLVYLALVLFRNKKISKVVTPTLRREIKQYFPGV